MEEKNYNRRYEKDYNIFRTIFYKFFVVLVVDTHAKLYYNFKVEGRENVPKDSHCIFAGNHVSYLDPPLIASAVRKTIAYMAKKELFEDQNKVLRFLVKRLGAFAVNREKPELATFKTVKSVFNTNWSLGIFPQGKIVHEHKLENIQKGFAVIAQKSKADIVPVAVVGFDGYAKKIGEKNITVKIGKPISHKLPADEILYQWACQISELAGYENLIPKPNNQTNEQENQTIDV